MLRENGLRIPLVCSGRKTPFFKRIEERMQGLGLGDQVQFVGYVSPVELRCLYQLSRCVVFPSRFEGWGIPVTEAFLAGERCPCKDSAESSCPAFQTVYMRAAAVASTRWPQSALGTQEPDAVGGYTATQSPSKSEEPGGGPWYPNPRAKTVRSGTASTARPRLPTRNGRRCAGNMRSPRKWR